ncbi:MULTISPECIES: hypothetical protein [Streptomyces]|uniref:hypothetical protein n=1 Tax=Streptomyces TaxID=1883 RepID=UPI00081DA680|nr:MULTISPECIES: hypothetical protein [unclassified Streptomyces]MYR93393.1 hypothetical protein [Streptomyces sp. SID4937]SCD51853.1 hypothetical protein GA0115243_102557 [Streptomyces sp. ScaeMP-e83]
MLVTAAMDALAHRLADHTDRPVTSDPTRVSATPCVLVEPPTIEPTTATLCGAQLYRYSVIVIGLPGARAELAPLADLLEEITGALDDLGIGWTLAEPVAYVPLQDAAAAEPCQAYRITVEELDR